MGADPNTSVVKQIPTELGRPQPLRRGAGNFPQERLLQPDGTVGALTYQALEAIRRSI